jgi:hypothetical protein
MSVDWAAKPAWGWRLLGWTNLILVGLMPLPNLPLMSTKGLLLTAPMYVAIAGTLSYAYGHAARPLWFWRIFALLFSLYTMVNLGPLLRAFSAALWSAPEVLGVRALSMAVGTLAICFLVCIALLRHAELLRGRQRAESRNLERIFT